MNGFNETTDRQGKVKKTLSNWYKLYFLQGRDDLAQKTIIHGGSIYGLDCKQGEDKEYAHALNSLFLNVYGAAFRTFTQSTI